MSQAPWYKRFASDLMSDPFVQAMTDEQYAWYSKMLDLSWIATPQAFLPNAKHLLAKMVAKCEQDHFVEHCQIVLDRFQTTEDGSQIYHPKMLEQAQKVAKVSKKRKLAGSEGGKAKAKQVLSKCQANAKQMPIDSDVDSDIDNKNTTTPIPQFIALPLRDDSEYQISEIAVKDWEGLYPRVDVRQQLRKMKAWLDANKKKRATKTGAKRFVVGWLNRTEEESQPAAKPGGKSLQERIADDERSWTA